MERIWVVKTKRSLELDAQRTLLEPLLDVFTRDLEDGGCPQEKIELVRICAEEIFVNIANYAYPEKDGAVQIEEEVFDNSICIMFADEGVPYNPLEKEDPDISASAQDREIGGLGIFMVKQMTDSLRYEYKDHRNCLYMECSW